ncbi:MAG: hypothetical protein ABIP75_15910 [Pyrinomonadaceae bacterium]
MKRITAMLLGLLFALGFPGPAMGQPTHLRRGRASRAQRGRSAGHPKIRAAIAALEAAKVELAAAPGDFGGHKNDALAAVDNALKRLRLALQFERY